MKTSHTPGICFNVRSVLVFLTWNLTLAKNVFGRELLSADSDACLAKQKQRPHGGNKTPTKRKSKKESMKSDCAKLDLTYTEQCGARNIFRKMPAKHGQGGQFGCNPAL